jgi:predicted DNA-binding transcriptional regulator YafY
LNDARQDLTNIALDRIQSLETSKKDFQENTQYDFNEYFDDIIGVSLTKNREPEKVELFITNGLYPYIETKPLHGSQKIISKNELGVIIQIEVIINHELEQLIMSYGESVKVLNPPLFATKIRDRIQRSIENYIGSNSVSL